MKRRQEKRAWVARAIEQRTRTRVAQAVCFGERRQSNSEVGIHHAWLHRQWGDLIHAGDVHLARTCVSKKFRTGPGWVQRPVEVRNDRDADAPWSGRRVDSLDNNHLHVPVGDRRPYGLNVVERIACLPEEGYRV